MDDRQMSILEHLNALRRALIVSIVSIIPGTAVGWFIRDYIMDILIRPVKAMHYKLVYIGATEAFMAEFKIAIFAGIVIALPVIAYQFWKFIMPALHRSERKYIVIFVPVSMIMFAVGIVFGYYTVFTYGIQFLLSFGGEGLTPMLSLGKYLSFAFWFLLPFGIMFELPLVILLLVRMGILNTKFLTSKRKWVLVASFVISAIATPTTDMFSQTVMAAAIYLLYEVSIWLSFLIKPKVRTKVEELPDKSVPEEPVPEEPVLEGQVIEATAIKENVVETEETSKEPSDVLSEANFEEESENISEGNTEKQDHADEEDPSRLADLYKQIIDQGNEETKQDDESVKKPDNNESK